MCYNGSQQLIFGIEYDSKADTPETIFFLTLTPHHFETSLPPCTDS